MAYNQTIKNLLAERLNIGWDRYGRGLLNQKNDNLNFRQEALEEVLDLVIYASADAVRNTSQVSAGLKVEYDGDEPRAKLSLKVNYEMDRDGNDAVFDNIVNHMTKKYDYSKDNTTEENHLMLLGISVLAEFVKKMEYTHA